MSFGFSIFLALGAAQSAATDIPCPAPEFSDAYAVNEAPNDIFSVKRLADDGSYEYIFTIDLNYGELTLMAVQVLYVTGDKLMLGATIETSPKTESQVLASVVVDETISADVRLVWSYFQSGALCPKIQHFRYDLTEN